MDASQLDTGVSERELRLDDAIRKTAPGTALRHALDMIIAGHLGALVCIGDTENVLAAGDDGFRLDVSFTANRLFELCKMDGAVVVDRDLTKILRANYHLNPDPSLPTSETGTRHRTASRMSLLTNAMVISVSERRSVVNVYVDGKGYQLKTVSELLALVNQLTNAMQNTRQQLDRSLLRLTSLELDNCVTLGDITNVLYLFETLITAGDELDDCVVQLGREGKTTQMQREEYLAGIDEAYTLMIRDYALDSSAEAARAIRVSLHDIVNTQLRSAKSVSKLLGYTDERADDSIMVPLGLRTLSRVPVVREGMADKIVDEYGSLQEVLEAVDDDPARLGEIGVKNPGVLGQQPAPHVGQGGEMSAPAPCVCEKTELVGASDRAPDTCAVIVAGGAGDRFGDPRGKQFVELCGLPLMCWSLVAHDRAPSVARLVVVCAPERAAEVERDVLSRVVLKKPTTLAAAGATRQESVLAGLRAMPRDLALVAVHDAARPLVETEMIERVISTVRADPRACGRHPCGSLDRHAQARGEGHHHRDAGPDVLLGGADAAGVSHPGAALCPSPGRARGVSGHRRRVARGALRRTRPRRRVLARQHQGDGPRGSRHRRGGP
jgi:diadenylate cyclase